jgi:hypothetical protein
MEDLSETVERYRKTASESLAASHTLLAAADIQTDVLKQMSVVIGQVTATTLSALADVLEQMSYSANASGSPIAQAKQLRARYNNALRQAFAKADTTGDYKEYDALVNGGLPQFEHPTQTPTS